MNKKSAIAVALMLTGLTACSDSDSNTADGEGAESSSYSVTAIDGYLRGAQVWLDLNGNFQLDIGEPSAITGEGGKADLDTSEVDNPEQYSVIVQAIKGETVDEDTITDENPNGTAVEKAYVMSAPPGESAVTPLSTLVDILIKQSAADGDTAEQIEQKKQKAIATISSQLGLSEDELLGDFIEKGHTDMIYVSQNLVAANVFPESADGLEEAAKDTSNKNDFSKKAAAVNAFIKKKVVEIKQDPDKSFESQEPIFTQDSDVVTDTDGDDVADLFDAFPNDPTEWVDTDEDGVGDNTDAFPEDASETKDTDGDGVGDNADAFPKDSTESKDTDGDGVGNNTDAFPDDATETVDTDGDGVGDNLDAFPLDQFETTDSDNDGYGDNTDVFPNNKDEWFDDDEDGVGNNADAFPDDATETVDSDSDGVGDNADLSPLDKNYFVNLRSYDKQLTVVGATEQPVVERGVLTTQANGDSVWVYLPMTQAQSLADFPDVSFDATSDAQTFLNLYMLVEPETDGMSEFEAAASNDTRHFKLKSYGPQGSDDPNKFVEIRLYQGESLNDLLMANNIDKSKFIVPVYHDGYGTPEPNKTGDGDYEAKGNFFLRFGDSNYTGYDEIALNRFSFEPTYQLMEEGAKFVTTASQVNGEIEMLPYGNARIQSNGASVWVYNQLDHDVPLDEIGDFSFNGHAEDEENVTGAIFANVYVKVKPDITPEALAQLESVASPNAWMPIRKTEWLDKDGETIYVFSMKESVNNNDKQSRVLSQLLSNHGLNISDYIAVPYYYESGDRESVGDAVTRGNFYVRFGDSRYEESENFYLTRYSFTPVHKLTTDSAPFMTTAAVTNATVEVKENAEVEITTGGDSVWAYTPIDREQPLTDFADFMFSAKDENGNAPAPNTFANVYLTSAPDISEEKLALLADLSSKAGAEMRNPGWDPMEDGRYIYVVTVPNQISLTAILNNKGFQRSDFHVLSFYDAPEAFDGDVEAKGNFFVRIGGSSYTGSGDKVILEYYSFEPAYTLNGNRWSFLTTATQTGATISGYGNPDQITVKANGQSVWFYYLITRSMPLTWFEHFSFTMTSTASSVSGGMFANVYLMPNSEEARADFQQAAANDDAHFEELTYGPEEGNYLKINVLNGETLGDLLDAQGLDSSDYTVVVYHDGATDGDPEAKGNFFIRTGDSNYTGKDTFTLSFNRANVDSDQDGVSDLLDAFPFDGTETADTDGDGVGDNADAFPYDALESVDTDGDNIGDNGDPDRDGDGVVNEDDAFDLDATEWADTDGDGLGNNADAFPYDPTKMYEHEKLAYDTFFGGQQVKASAENMGSLDDSSGYFTGYTAGESVWFYTPFPQELVDAGYLLSAVPDFSFAVNQGEEAFNGGSNIFANVYVTPTDADAYARITATGNVQTNGGAPLRDTNWNTEKVNGVIVEDAHPELDTYVITIQHGETLNQVMQNVGVAKSDFRLLSFIDSPRTEDGDQEAVNANFILKLGDSGYDDSNEYFIVNEYSFTPKFTIGDGPEFVVGDAVSLTQDSETGAVTGDSYGKRIFGYVPMGLDSEPYSEIASLADYQNLVFEAESSSSFVNVYVVAKEQSMEADLIAKDNFNSLGLFRHVTWAKTYQPDGKEVFAINLVNNHRSLTESLDASGLDIEDFNMIAFVDGGHDGDPAGKGNFFFKNDGNKDGTSSLNLTQFEY